MARSRRFRSLARRVAQLAGDLLPRANPAGNYTAAEQDRIRAFRLLVHAEFEGFIEEAITLIAVHAYVKYSTTAVPSRTMIAIAQSYCHDPEVRAANDVFEASVKQHLYAIERNHGLRTRNLLNLILPLGVRQDEIDAAWLNAMDTFGTRRGEVAHTPLRVQVGTILDPIVEGSTVTQLLTELNVFDQQLTDLRRSA